MSILDTAVSRIPFGEHDGRSGGSLERVVLADGERLVVKRSDFTTDLGRRLTADVDGREYGLWRAGVLDRLPAGVGHAIVDGWREGTETVLVMRDLGDAVFGWDDVLTGDEISRVLAAMVSLHATAPAAKAAGAAEAAGAADPVGGLLTPLAGRIGVFRPDRIRPLAGSFPLADAVLTGWDCFADLVDTGIAAAVRALLDDPAPLVDALARRPCAMIHGDLWPVNMAVTGESVVLLDWGLATWAPPALDIVSFLAGAGAANIVSSRESVIDEYRRLCGPAHDEEALTLALLCGLIDFGWNKALDAATASDPVDRARHRADFDWWIGRGRTALHLLRRLRS